MNKINATIGKFALDSLTIGMYEDELVLYREYIQNCTDSIDKAIKRGILNSIDESKIDVIIDKENKKIVISDNGCGIPKDKVVSKLCDIGNSGKDYNNNRGFRGIGRLAGTAYCEKLIFTTSSKGENKRSVLTWDCVKLKRLLKPGENTGLDLQRVIELCVTFEVYDEEESKHYFEVNLEGITKVDKLLDVNFVYDYLAQVAPVEIDSCKFYYYSDKKVGIKSFMKEKDITIEEYPIEVNKRKLTKLYSATIKDSKNDKVDDIIGVCKELILDNNGTAIAFLWYGEREKCIGQISDDKIAGLRYRKDNIMVGNSDTVSKLFSQGRFNKYFIGEIYILDKSIIPNARRDEFEDTETYSILKEKLSLYAKRLSIIAQAKSDKSNAKKRYIDNNKRIEELTAKIENEKLPKEKKELIKEELQSIKEKNEKDRKVIERSNKKLIDNKSLSSSAITDVDNKKINTEELVDKALEAINKVGKK